MGGVLTHTTFLSTGDMEGGKYGSGKGSWRGEEVEAVEADEPPNTKADLYRKSKSVQFATTFEADDGTGKKSMAMGRSDSSLSSSMRRTTDVLFGGACVLSGAVEGVQWSIGLLLVINRPLTQSGRQD